MVGSGQPEVHREERGLRTESKKQESPGCQHHRLSRAPFKQTVEVSHVEASGGSVEQTDAGDNGNRGDKVEPNVFHCTVELSLAAANHQ